MIEPTKLAIAGDWHGNGHWARSAIQYAATHGADTIFHVGDFGFWTPGHKTDDYLYTVERALKTEGLRLYWIDGNHEDHSRRDEFNDDDRPLTVYVPRGTRWDWWGKRWMGVGGAYSIDRYLRAEGRGWWPQELLSDEELAFACREEDQPVDIVLSHDCPAGVSIPGIGPDSKPRGGKDIWPPDMLAGAAAHRRKMRQIWQRTKPKYWWHGHYHVPYSIYYGPTKFYGLDCDGAKAGMSENVMIVTPEDVK